MGQNDTFYGGRSVAVWVCGKCETICGEAAFPITPKTKVPICPQCKTWVHIDIAVDSNVEMDSETVVWNDKGAE